jgi:beta-1,4-mannosyl-glycoprotein beta-1,4-N-acetylglucosaminyltransferase
MLYDCFPFFDELDRLEIRLNVLNEIVDRFVLVESPLTHHGQDKPLFYAENQARFAPFRDKIIHVVSENPPPAPRMDEAAQIWRFENFQRDAVMRGLADCRQDDVVLISDVDEIPDPAKVAAWRDTPGIKVFEQQMMYYYLNMRCWTKPVWRGTRMGRLADLLDPAQDLRPYAGISFSRKGLPTYFRHCDGPRVKGGGWHFSYCGGAEAIMKKMRSIAETQAGELADRVAAADFASIRRAVVRGRDIYGRGKLFYVVVDLKELPQYVQKNAEAYRGLIVFQDARERLVAKAYFLANIALYLYARIWRPIPRRLRKWGLIR